MVSWEEEKEDPDHPRCPQDRMFLERMLGKTADGRSYWRCPRCKAIIKK